MSTSDAESSRRSHNGEIDRVFFFNKTNPRDIVVCPNKGLLSTNRCSQRKRTPHSDIPACGSAEKADEVTMVNIAEFSVMWRSTENCYDYYYEKIVRLQKFEDEIYLG